MASKHYTSKCYLSNLVSEYLLHWDVGWYSFTLVLLQCNYVAVIFWVEMGKLFGPSIGLVPCYPDTTCRGGGGLTN